MSDYSRLSDEELLKALQGGPKAAGVEGMSDGDLLAALGHGTPEPQNSAAGIAKAYGVGVGEGTIGIAGMPGDIASGMNYLGKKAVGLGQKIGGYLTGEEVPAEVRDGPSIPAPNSRNIRSAVENVTGEFYEPQTTAEEYANTLGEFTPGLLGGGGSMAGRAIGQVALPALTSETAGQMTEGTWLEPYARIGGGLMGGAAPGAARRAITPFPVSPERGRQLQVLRNEGVEVTGGQASGSKGLRNFEDELGGGSAGNITERQGEQFTSAALRRAGINADRATPEVIDEAFTRIGQQFDDLSARNRADVDQQFIQDVVQVQDDYRMLANPLQRQIVEQAVNDVVDVIGQHNGSIPGDVYRTMRERLGKAARGAGGDNQLREAYQGLFEALDDAMERTIANANPDDLGAWREVRNQYRNMFVIEQAAAGAGENTAMGILSPSQLRGATAQKHGKRNYVRGQGDFAELARAGEAILRPLPNSGTPGRTAARNIGQGLSSVAGAVVGGAAGGGAGAGVGLLAGAAVPPALARLALSPWGRAYLANQLMAQNPGMTRGQAMFQAALASREGRERMGGPKKKSIEQKR